MSMLPEGIYDLHSQLSLSLSWLTRGFHASASSCARHKRVDRARDLVTSRAGYGSAGVGRPDLRPPWKIW
jgi:hypothetical protein